MYPKVGIACDIGFIIICITRYQWVSNRTNSTDTAKPSTSSSPNQSTTQSPVANQNTSSTSEILRFWTTRPSTSNATTPPTKLYLALANSSQDYYELNMSPPSPNIIHLQHYKLIETNHRKHIKLMVMMEKSQARRNEQPQSQEEEAQAHMILSKIDDSNFSELNSQKQEDNESDSYDSQPFNAYQLGQDQASFYSKIRQGQVISIKQVSDSFLVLDFKAPADDPKINVLPPVLPPLPPPKIQKSSIGIQTIPIEPVAVKIPEKQAPPKVVMIPQLKKQPPSSSASQLQQKAQLKKENMILTASIEMAYRKQQKSKQKSKPSTFMQYYNSQPVKAPSNILERYIKRKK